MLTWDNVLFYTIFLGQILLISSYFPGKLLGRMRTVLETYPPSQYPRLYPKPIEYYKIGLGAFKVINRCIFVLGFLILLAMLTVVDHNTFADDGFISEAWPAAYGVIQFLPLVLLEFTGFSHLKLMREANSATTRRAELRQRRLFDSVSPTLLGLAVLFFLTALLCDLFLPQFVLEWGALGTSIVLIGSNLFLVAVGAWHLYGPKLDPHQAIGDRARQRGVHLNSLLYVSMALSVYFMTVTADDAFNLDFLDATLMSLYFQVIVFLSIGHVLRSLKLEDIDFDVYKNDTALP